MNTNNYFPSILIVEDDADWSMIIKSCIYNICPCAHVKIAENSSDAYFFIENQIVNLVVLDIRLYDKGDTFEGIHLLNYLQEKKENIPIVIVSAHARIEYLLDFFKKINIRYFPKQRFDIVEFQNFVNGLIVR